MSEVQRARGGDRPTFGRFGLSRAALEGAIVAVLEEAEDGSDPEVLASAVAAAIEANNEELLRHVKEMLAGSAKRAGADVQPDDGPAAH
jgi:hypothetical protein